MRERERACSVRNVWESHFHLQAHSTLIYTTTTGKVIKHYPVTATHGEKATSNLLNLSYTQCWMTGISPRPVSLCLSALFLLFLAFHDDTLLSWNRCQFGHMIQQFCCQSVYIFCPFIRDSIFEKHVRALQARVPCRSYYISVLLGPAKLSMLNV